MLFEEGLYIDCPDYTQRILTKYVAALGACAVTAASSRHNFTMCSFNIYLKKVNLLQRKRQYGGIRGACIKSSIGVERNRILFIFFPPEVGWILCTEPSKLVYMIQIPIPIT